MLNCHHDNGGPRAGAELRGLLTDVHRREGGAIAMLCLAAALILLLMSWLIFDAILVTNHKIDTQGSADMAAFSQASVKSRSMNMMAFSNVGKRSIVGVHAVYQSMFDSYGIWLQQRVDWCENDMPQCDEEEMEENLELYFQEADNDYESYEANTDYYLGDLRALDNYQQYIMDMTPWWGWSEAVLRAQRNGATLASSFPPPGGTPAGEFDSVLNPVVDEVGGTAGFNILSHTDRLPMVTGTFWADMIHGGMDGRDAWETEHRINVDHHQARSERGARSTEVIDMGATHMMTAGLQHTYDQIGDHGAPWRLESYDREWDWLFDTSNIVITYSHQPHYFDGMRNLYEEILQDYDDDPDELVSQGYRPSGYWGMARSEISFQGEGNPDEWRASWTARMRPIAFPDEFQAAGYDFNAVYHFTLDHLMLSARMHGGIGTTGDFMNDLAYFERVSRSMGQSTIEGVAR